MLKVFFSVLAALVVFSVVAGIILTDGTCLKTGAVRMPIALPPPTEPLLGAPPPQLPPAPPIPSPPKQPAYPEPSNQNILPPAPAAICPDQRPVVQVVIPPATNPPPTKKAPCSPAIKEMKCDWLWEGNHYLVIRKKEACAIILKEALEVRSPGCGKDKAYRIDLVVFFGSPIALASVKEYIEPSGKVSIQIGLHLKGDEQGFLLTKEWLGSLSHFWPALEYARKIQATPIQPTPCVSGITRRIKVFLPECFAAPRCPDWNSFTLVEAKRN